MFADRRPILALLDSHGQHELQLLGDDASKADCQLVSAVSSASGAQCLIGGRLISGGSRTFWRTVLVRRQRVVRDDATEVAKNTAWVRMAGVDLDTVSFDASAAETRRHRRRALR